MAGGFGRKFILQWDGAEVAGVRTKGVTINGEVVDISDDDSDGWRELFPEAGEITVEFKLSGLVKDDRLQVAALEHDNRIHAATLTDPQGGIISGNFALQNYSQGLEYKGYSTMDLTLLSSGPVTFVPGT
jgi:TP901-1 family phage major tail protein